MKITGVAGRAVALVRAMGRIPSNDNVATPGNDNGPGPASPGAFGRVAWSTAA